ncbi:hypothetical protein L484_021206 [Morus notabilis]|uniref:Uncharacterized protein n=1 Tax=Morus notabilis TaxID=981085 RepID=W9S3L4_9ROSA|nr:hypothetical protein L484_021206 [Morus notabilis]
MAGGTSRGEAHLGAMDGMEEKTEGFRGRVDWVFSFFSPLIWVLLDINNGLGRIGNHKTSRGSPTKPQDGPHHPLFELVKRLVVDHGFHVSFVNITADSTAAQTQLLHSPTLPPLLHVIDLPPADVIEDTHSLLLTRICLLVQENLKMSQISSPLS